MWEDEAATTWHKSEKMKARGETEACDAGRRGVALPIERADVASNPHPQRTHGKQKQRSLPNKKTKRLHSFQNDPGCRKQQGGARPALDTGQRKR